MKPEDAEVIGLTALTWLVGNEELLPVFLGASGAGIDDLKQGAGNPEFLAAVLDFLTMDDDWVVEFCRANTLPYDAPMRARHALPGGGQMNWT
ncbi:hypothetical protein XMM379_001338 [Aliiroseovarius sp. xm-m-379]|uniref:DUF3572 domain-containing protein n=1 Tax=unclassified Aliiroseovarius TaxID=2623558 RepID=UPI001568215A|nr:MULTISPECIES: DUF3572 domain-containing protein [unclassified Aliiroseovarius]NRP12275.1 hypothetical protein [Aliiroseovarius sp. xm-d-517]NRP24649.1 hypothetical protein [Aliiroseovarius sp. xm-m-379]NRP30717.1 hypothetical protein [Aliiroseovarius sp. xm-m-314]NRP33448.1 hypothetical protein [Aliiroseovarius sp. xm-a-104]NRP40555.1 hypothetical protein [Aliiroseovarius sp. xm-m-339-2]